LPATTARISSQGALNPPIRGLTGVPQTACCRWRSAAHDLSAPLLKYLLIGPPILVAVRRLFEIARPTPAAINRSWARSLGRLSRSRVRGFAFLPAQRPFVAKLTQRQ